MLSALWGGEGAVLRTDVFKDLIYLQVLHMQCITTFKTIKRRYPNTSENCFEN